MYLISSGAVAVEGDKGQRFATLRSGQYFGRWHYCFQCLERRHVEQSNIQMWFCLHYNDLHDIVEEYPEVLESITRSTLEKLETMKGIKEDTKRA